MTSARTYALCRVVLLACIAIASVAAPSGAATNVVTAGIRGLDNGTLLGGDGTGSGRFVLNPVELALIKQARALDGTVMPDSADVSAGEEIYFVLLVDNPTDAPAPDLRLRDSLDETQFTYVAGTLESTTVSSGATDDDVWAGTWSPLTDGVGAPDDGGSVLDTGALPDADLITIGAEPGQANLAIDVSPGTLRAFRFRVRVSP